MFVAYFADNQNDVMSPGTDTGDDREKRPASPNYNIVTKVGNRTALVNPSGRIMGKVTGMLLMHGARNCAFYEPPIVPNSFDKAAFDVLAAALV